MLEEQDDTILARWLEGKLTLEEQTAFEKSEEFKDYSRIAQGMQRFQKPEYDKEALREKVFLATDKAISERKVVIFKPWGYAAAATILLLLCAGLYFNEVDYITHTGEQLVIYLPDGSKVNLNAGSHLKRKRFFWSSDRSVTLLVGEGFFEVEKGDEGFQVETDAGTTKVLGTKFNLKTREDVFALSCYQGKILFEESGTKDKTVLIQGQEIIKSENNFIKDSLSGTQPAWMMGRSVFKNVPLKRVMDELEIQYGITFENNSADLSRNFTGSFVHGNLQTALKTVFVPMGIEYSMGNGGNSVTLKPSE